MSWLSNGKVRKSIKTQYLDKLEYENGSIESAKEAFFKRGGKIEKVDITDPKAEILNEVGDNSKRFYNLIK